MTADKMSAARVLDYIDARQMAKAMARWRVAGDLPDEQLQEDSVACRYLNRRIAELTEDYVPYAIAAIKALGAEPVDVATLQREAEAERARADAMREALEPFAKEAALWPDYVPDSDGLFIASPDDIEPILDEYAAEQGRASAGISFSNDTVTVGDLRRARAALSQASGASILPKEDGVWLHVRDGDKSTLTNFSAFLDALHGFEATLLLEHGSESEALLHWQERIAPMIERTETALSQARGEPSLSSEGK